MRATETASIPEKTVGIKEGEVIITGIGHTSPGHPVILAKHSAKEERAAMEKGKWSTDLSTYAHLSAQELHSGFLNRLHSNRDYEAGLVNLMKQRYEVFSSLSFLEYKVQTSTQVAPKGRLMMTNINRDCIIH